VKQSKGDIRASGRVAANVLDILKPVAPDPRRGKDSVLEAAKIVANAFRNNNVKDEETAKAVLEKELAPFTAEGRRKILEGVSAILGNNAKAAKARIREKKDKLEVYTALTDWLTSLIDNGVILQPNDTSRLHKLLESGIEIDGSDTSDPTNGFLKNYNHTFVVKHDWAGAFTNAEIPEGEFKLPFPLCAFEFRINNHTVIALAWDAETGLPVGPHPVGFGVIVEVKGFWFSVGVSKSGASEDLLIDFVAKQLKCILVALDAEVATHEVIRAPTALNDKRAKSGKPPLKDYYVIDLARRHRVTNPNPTPDDTKRKVRLHFRRGHWRHYEGHKTWIKWMLVGNPDLGFIQKRYSL
jgi:hypothetical protein